MNERGQEEEVWRFLSLLTSTFVRSDRGSSSATGSYSRWVSTSTVSRFDMHLLSSTLPISKGRPGRRGLTVHQLLVGSNIYWFGFSLTIISICLVSLNSDMVLSVMVSTATLFCQSWFRGHDIILARLWWPEHRGFVFQRRIDIN